MQGTSHAPLGCLCFTGEIITLNCPYTNGSEDEVGDLLS
jgi:hypothetical protein